MITFQVKNIAQTFLLYEHILIYTMKTAFLLGAMNQVLEADEFIKLKNQGLSLVDVRTPAEFDSGHIPGAVNIPLFDNNERVQVGTLYKQKSRNDAILKGLEFIGPKMKPMAEEIISHVKENQVLIHCWRGGMRSSSVAWMMNLLGVKTYTLKKGYKNFRRYVLDTFCLPFYLLILGGKTGSAKTEILKEIKRQGGAVVDLEGLAEHKGSAFGQLGNAQKVSQEMFENLLAVELRNAGVKNTIWLEDESRTIGRISIPEKFWKQMRESHVEYIEIPISERVNFLMENYGKPEYLPGLMESLNNIKKRLGDIRFKTALSSLESGDMKEAIVTVLDYYDRAYAYGLSKRNPESIEYHKFEKLNQEDIARKLLKESLCQK